MSEIKTQKPADVKPTETAKVDLKKSNLKE